MLRYEDPQLSEIPQNRTVKTTIETTVSGNPRSPRGGKTDISKSSFCQIFKSGMDLATFWPNHWSNHQKDQEIE